MDKSRDAYEYLATGDAWVDFCEEMKEFREDILRTTAPKEGYDLAEAHRFLTRHLRSAFELIVEGGDPGRPWLFRSLHETMKMGWDNPDNVHTNAYLSGDSTYRLWGTRGAAHYMSLALYGGSLGSGGRNTSNYVAIDDLEIALDGSFEVILSTREHSGNWIRMKPDTTTLMVRETFWDKINEEQAVLKIECLERSDAPPPLDPSFVVNALRRSLRYVRGSNKLYFDMSDMWRAKPNTFFPSDPVVAESSMGIPDMYYASGWWACAEDEALVLDVMPPDCRYWGFVLSNYWARVSSTVIASSLRTRNEPRIETMDHFESSSLIEIRSWAGQPGWTARDTSKGSGRSGGWRRIHTLCRTFVAFDSMCLGTRLRMEFDFDRFDIEFEGNCSALRTERRALPRRWPYET